ncbi:phage minor head protein [Streptomyces sp. NPDC046374]|uniref:phage minor head protein n=1 Tax=Streptomyces sp. NPDC046374 TaxID=3154917 RepID=UPI0033D9647C
MPREQDERELEAAIVEAMTVYLDAARRAVLDGKAPPADGVLVAAGAPDMRNWPGEGLWRATVDRLIRPVVERVYRRSYRDTAGHDPAPADVQRAGDTAAQQIGGGGWLRRVWAAAQQALTESQTRQEPDELARRRLEDVLTIDAPSRATRDAMAEYRRIVATADMSDAARRAAMGELDRAEGRPVRGRPPTRPGPELPDDVRRALDAIARVRQQPPEEQGRPWRSEATTTAVTETTNTESAGAYDAGQTSEQTTGRATARKKWVATRDPATGELDDRVREAHRLADGQEVALDEPFQVGGEALRYPGDPNGAAGNVINCRCSVRVVPVITVTAAAKESSMSSTTAAVSAATNLPFAPRETPWDGDAARAAVRKWATDDKGQLDTAKFGRAFLWHDPDAPPSSYKLPFATVIGGELRAVWNGVSAAAAAMNGSRGGVTGLTPEQENQVKARIATLYRGAAKAFHDASIKAPFEKEKTTTTASAQGCGGACACAAANTPQETAPAQGLPIVQAGTRPPACPGTCGAPHVEPEGKPAEMLERTRRIVAAAIGDEDEWRPRAAWFTPHNGDKHGIRISQQGRVAGYLATWDGMIGANCHVGIKDRCTPPPRNASGLYPNFHQDSTILTLDDGTQIHPGLLTMDIGHGPQYVNQEARVAHYDNPNAMAAAVIAGEDATGIWVAGEVIPRVRKDPDKMTALRLSRFSGHWEPVDGKLELIAATGVNVPGYQNASKTGYRIAASAAPGQDLAPAPVIVPGGDVDRIVQLLGLPATEVREVALHPAHAAELQQIVANAVGVDVKPVEQVEEETPAAASPEGGCGCGEPVEADVPVQDGDEATAATTAAADGDGWRDLPPLDDEAAAVVMAIIEEAGEPEDKEVTAAAQLLTLIASGKGGGLPDYVERTAKHIQERTGFDKSHSIAAAWIAVKKICASGDSTLPGKQNVNAASRAQACQAVATIGSLSIQASAHAAEESGASAKAKADTEEPEKPEGEQQDGEQQDEKDGEPEAAEEPEKVEV